MPDEITDSVMEEAGKSHLNSVVALLVAITATFMAVSKVKDDNIVQHMQELNSQIVDTWSQYQAKSTKQNLAEMVVSQIKLLQQMQQDGTSGTKSRLAAELDTYEKKYNRYDGEKSDLKKAAEKLTAEHDELSNHDDQMDFSDAALSISLSLFALTALTQKRWLIYMGAFFAVVGVFWGVAGFMGLAFHPGFLFRWLT